jgi:hypothetical protein
VQGRASGRLYPFRRPLSQDHRDRLRKTRRHRYPRQNAAHQASFKSIEDISDEEWELDIQGQYPRDVLPD